MRHDSLSTPIHAFLDTFQPRLLALAGHRGLLEHLFHQVRVLSGDGTSDTLSEDQRGDILQEVQRGSPRKESSNKNARRSSAQIQRTASKNSTSNHI